MTVKIDDATYELTPPQMASLRAFVAAFPEDQE